MPERNRPSRYDEAGLDRLARVGLLVEGDFSDVTSIDVSDLKKGRITVDVSAIPFKNGTSRDHDTRTLFVPNKKQADIFFKD